MKTIFVAVLALAATLAQAQDRNVVITAARLLDVRTGQYILGLRQAIDEGKLAGPRVITATHAIGSTGGHCDMTYYPPSMEQKSRYNFDSADEARKRLREIRKHGAQMIKICATGGVFSLNTEPGQQQLSLVEMKAIVEEAHMQGLKVAAHAHGASGIRDAILAGVDTIEHASHRAGAKMIFGTDAGIFPHGQNAAQFRWMVRYGMTPLEAIQSATLNAAQALGRDDVGIVEKGRFGDLIAVRGDPLRDVTLLESVAVVIKGGERVK